MSRLRLVGPGAGWVSRLSEMTLGWGFVGLVYQVTAALQGQPVAVIAETALDRAIPFDPIGIWAYLSFFALIPCAFLFCDKSRLRWLSRSMQGCALLCGATYLCWPTTLVYPAITDHSASAEMLHRLIGVDAATNCFPSLHGALSLLAIQALLPSRRFIDGRAMLLCLWGLAIAYSVIQTRRHLALDLSAGVLAGALCGMAVRALQSLRRNIGARTGQHVAER